MHRSVGGAQKKQETLFRKNLSRWALKHAEEHRHEAHLRFLPPFLVDAETDHSWPSQVETTPIAGMFRAPLSSVCFTVRGDLYL